MLGRPSVRLSRVVLAALLAGSALVPLGGTPARPNDQPMRLAASGSAEFPGASRSHYLTRVDPAALRTLGRRDATVVAGELSEALVVLAAGDPAPGATVRLPDSGRLTDHGDVRRLAVAYATSWRSVPGRPRLVLVVGATNFGGFVDRETGAQWGELVSSIAADVPGLDVRGGLDAEVEWSPADAARQWLTGYLAATDRPFVHFGSCTCPPLAPLPEGWTRADLHELASAQGRGSVLPQIYATGGGNARQWAAVAEWGREQGLAPVRFVGVLTQRAACAGPPWRPCAGTDLDPASAWRQLSRASGQRLRFATDIGYLSSDMPAPPARPSRWVDTIVVLLAAGGLVLLIARLRRSGRFR